MPTLIVTKNDDALEMIQNQTIAENLLFSSSLWLKKFREKSTLTSYGVAVANVEYFPEGLDTLIKEIETLLARYKGMR